MSVLFSALFLLFAIVYGLSHVVADPPAACFVALALAIVAGVLLASGVGRFSRCPSDTGLNRGKHQGEHEMGENNRPNSCSH